MHTPNLTFQIRRFLPTESETIELGGALGRVLEPGLVVYLVGELGAGKTTLARGILRGLGYTGRVKSPTFTLVEPYTFLKLNLYHFDFYRFDHQQNLRESGFGEYFDADAVCLIEWPEKAAGLPEPDVTIELAVSGSGRSVHLHANTKAGRLCLQRLQDSNTT